MICSTSLRRRSAPDHSRASSRVNSLMTRSLKWTPVVRMSLLRYVAEFLGDLISVGSTPELVVLVPDTHAESCARTFITLSLLILHFMV